MKAFLKLFSIALFLCLPLSGCILSHMEPSSVPFSAEGLATAPKIEPLRALPSLARIRGDRCMISLKSWEFSPLERTEPLAPAIEPLVEPPLQKDPDLDILVVGDSLSVGIGAAFAAILKSKDGVSVTEAGKVASGLNSPKFYDWESKLTEFVAEHNPELVLIMIGGNDAHNGSGSDAWAADFEEKARRFLAIAQDQGAFVYWVGLPPMQKPVFSKKVKLANEVMRQVCGSSGRCKYVDTWDAAAGDDGGFAKRKHINGRLVSFRSGDGCHFTFTGYKALSRHIMSRMSELTEIKAAEAP